jgi:hypothetical protein
MSKYFDTPLRKRKIENFPKIWDLVSDDGRIAGDAKYLTFGNAKMEGIGQHVWLRDNCPRARRRFLVFGNDVELPQRWLRKYGSIKLTVEFHFLVGGKLTPLR